MRVAFKETGPGWSKITPVKHQTVWDAAELLSYDLNLERARILDLKRDYKGPWVPVFRAFNNDLIRGLIEKGHMSVPFDGMFGRMQVTSAFNDDLISHRGRIACSGRFFVSAHVYGSRAPEKDRSVLVMAVPAEVLLDDKVTLLSKDDYMFFTTVLGRMIIERINTLRGRGATLAELQKERRKILKRLLPIHKKEGSGSIRPWIDWLNQAIKMVMEGDLKGTSIDDIAYYIGRNAGQLLNYKWVHIARRLDYSGKTEEEKYDLLIRVLREDEFIARFIDNFEQQIAEESRTNKGRLKTILEQTMSLSDTERRIGELRLVRFMDSIEEVIMEPHLANKFLETTRRFQIEPSMTRNLYKTNICEDALFLPMFGNIQDLVDGNIEVLSSLGHLLQEEQQPGSSDYFALGYSGPMKHVTTFTVEGLFKVVWVHDPENECHPEIKFDAQDPKQLLTRYETFMARLKEMQYKNEAVLMLIEFLSHFRPYIEAFAL